MLVRTAAVAGMLSAFLAVTTTPAEAGTTSTTESCSADGMTGTLKFVHSSTRRTIYRVLYKITDNGRDEGNIWVVDHGIYPSKKYSTSSADQNGEWHILREKNYTRGSADIDFKFTFDQPWFDDSCTEGIW